MSDIRTQDPMTFQIMGGNCANQLVLEVLYKAFSCKRHLFLFVGCIEDVEFIVFPLFKPSAAQHHERRFPSIRSMCKGNFMFFAMPRH